MVKCGIKICNNLSKVLQQKVHVLDLAFRRTKKYKVHFFKSSVKNNIKTMFIKINYEYKIPWIWTDNRDG